MNIELYELRLVKRIAQSEDVNGNENILLDSAFWVKCDIDAKWRQDTNSYANRLSTFNSCLRLQSLIHFKQCFAKASILFDISANTSGQLVADALEESLSERMGMPIEHIRTLFQPNRFLRFRDENQPSSNTLRKCKKCEISIVDTNDLQTSRRVVKSMVTRKRQASANVEHMRAKFKRFWSSMCPWRMQYNAKEADEKAGTKCGLENCRTVQICVGALGTCQKPQMIFTRLSDANANMDDDPEAKHSTKFLVFIFGPPTWRIDYLELGRCCVVAFSNQIFINIANKAANCEQFRIAVDRFLSNSVVIPPEPAHYWTSLKLNKIKRMLSNAFVGWTTDGRRMSTESENSLLYSAAAITCPEPKAKDPYDPLRRTGRLFHGFANDIRHRYKDYASDLTDAFRMKCVVATILTFFNTFASCIALGEVLGTKTKRWMGLSEVLVAQCVCGVLWGFFAGQPLIIQTTTAAFVMFEGSLYKFCDAHGLEYLVIRVWTGAWVLLLTIFMVMLETPFLIRYVTRFTEEVFDALISVVFIYESLLFLFETFEVHPLRDLVGYCEVLNTSLPKGRNVPSRLGGGLVAAMFDAGSAAANILLGNKSHGHDVVIIKQNAYEFSPIPEEEFHYDHGDILGQPNSALLTLILMMATFFLASYLDSLKRTFYFGRTFREMIGNFSVPIALPMVSLAADLLFQSTHIHRVNMADDFAPTEPSRRGWFVNPLGMFVELPMWAIFASIAPAFLVSILLFVELELAEFSFHRKERGLRKGSGFHSDLLLSGLLMFICGLMGLPWLGAGPVQSRAHLGTLTVRQRAPPGEDAKIDYVVEQRLTSVAVALILGACAFLGRALIRIPVAVLMGVFVYLGVRSLCELQFVRRVILYIVPRKYYPDAKYSQQVPMWRMHFYTAVQIMCFAALFAVEVVPQISVVFPFVVTIIAVFRHIFLPLAFKNEELNSLDAEQEDSDAEDA